MRHTLTILTLALALGLPGAVLAGPVEESQRRKAIELNKDLVLAHYGLGQSYMGLKRFPDAVQAFSGSRPDYGQAHSNLAVIYMMTGQIPESRAAVEKAEKSGFTVNPKLKEELDRRAAAR